MNALDQAGIDRLNAVLDACPGLTVVIASHWLHLWSVTDIAQMLQHRGYRGTKFSAARPLRTDPSTAKIGRWMDTAIECGKDVAGYAIWADECPVDQLAHLAVGVPRTIGLLKMGAAS